MTDLVTTELKSFKRMTKLEASYDSMEDSLYKLELTMMYFNKALANLTKKVLEWPKLTS